MWLKGSRVMGPSALVGIVALIAIEYAASGGQLIPTKAPRPAPDASFRAHLHRGPCLGSCPVYTLDLDAAGNVTFLGEKSAMGAGAPCQGEHHWKVAPAAVAKLEAQIDRIGFFGFKDRYQASITDAPAFTVTITRRGRTKSVFDYVGQMAGAPPSLGDLEIAIDDAANDKACIVAAAPAP